MTSLPGAAIATDAKLDRAGSIREPEGGEPICSPAGAVQQAAALIQINECSAYALILSASAEEKAMSVNVGTVDRALRVVIGLALIAFAIPVGFPNTGWNWIGWIGVVPIITAVVGNCPAYSVLGFSTRT